MADVTENQNIDVKSYTHGTDVYLGIQSISFTRFRGRLLPIRKEGELVASAFELVGTDEGPVTFTLRSRSDSTLKTLADQDAATVTFDTRLGGAGSDRRITMTGVQYEQSGGELQRDAQGFYNLSGKALTIDVGTAE